MLAALGLARQRIAVRHVSSSFIFRRSSASSRQVRDLDLRQLQGVVIVDRKPVYGAAHPARQVKFRGPINRWRESLESVRPFDQRRSREKGINSFEDRLGPSTRGCRRRSFRLTRWAYLPPARHSLRKAALRLRSALPSGSTLMLTKRLVGQLERGEKNPVGASIGAYRRRTRAYPRQQP